MTSNKRKRSREEDGERSSQPSHQQLDEQPEQKKPHKNPSGIIASAIEKILELERYVNQVNAAEDDDNSEYSDSSDSGRYEASSTHSDDNDGPVIRPEEDEDTTTTFNPEIVGFAICAQETMNFLRKEGFSEDNPLILSMQHRLLEQLNRYQMTLNRDSKKL